MFLFMTMLSSLKPPGKNYSVTEPGAHILLGYDNAQYFETPRIKNHSVTSPTALIVLGDEDAQYYETPIKQQSQCNCNKCLDFFTIQFTAMPTQAQNS